MVCQTIRNDFWTVQKDTTSQGSYRFLHMKIIWFAIIQDGCHSKSVPLEWKTSSYHRKKLHKFYILFRTFYIKNLILVSYFIPKFLYRNHSKELLLSFKKVHQNWFKITWFLPGNYDLPKKQVMSKRWIWNPVPFILGF